MIGAFEAAWGLEGFWWLVLIIGVAGLVRGFAGFGTGMVFIPLGSIFLDPLWVLAAVIAVDVAGSAPVLPRAIRDVRGRDLMFMLMGCVVTLPLGTYALTASDPALFRWGVSGLSLALVALLISGWRHHVEIGPKGLVGVGAASGFLGGFVGMPGPPVVLAYLGGQYRPERVRATTLLFMLMFVALLGVVLALRGVLEGGGLALGILLIPAYVAGNLAGQALFDPGRARLYRAVAYGVFIASALAGLPIFGG
ncbi:sulfite exporter TauE/SafE family protein [Oceanicola sp. 502str15]|uniref:sulfite exporter TauE/SafE family protein n=1 Tax=Oceanicola sp. 502str15 TaxID=2696061 RepID=UPI002094EECF|nr:sulfite exporter TauE/SafE family protein [Oceanicola sp. 502str15]MCO6382276.1 TSUP family transporter [Oceanicola sp. 502str15]